jgi:hypothetical protein
MIRQTFSALALLLIAVTAVADNRGHVSGPSQIPGTTVSGFVTAVNGSSVTLANGLVTIDVSHATITNDRGGTATIAPGSLIFATVNTSLVATTVVVSTTPQVTLSGPVQSVNASAGTLQVLGLTIHTDANTSFGGDHGIRRLSDIATNDVVVVQANNVNGSLLASSILVFAPMQQLFPTLLHGTVKSIGTDSWVITDSHRGDTTVVVNNQTRILGSPKVGDTVDVLANVDSAHNFVAIAISVSPVFNSHLHFTGVVKQIGTNSWVIGPSAGLGPDTIVQVNSQTKIVGDPHVGDRVDVVLDPSSALNVALSITKL